MTYRKFFADRLFTGHEMIDEPVVLVTDQAGVVQDIAGPAEAGEAPRLSGTLCPGFINCHCHLELSHMRGRIPEGAGMIEFLLAVMRSRGASHENIRRAAAAAEQEMVANGIVAVGDICNTDHTIALKREGLLYYHNFVEVMGFDGNAAASRFKEAVALYRKFEEGLDPENRRSTGASPGSYSETQGSGSGSRDVDPNRARSVAREALFDRLRPGPGGFLPAVSICPHSPYSVSPGLISLVNDHPTGSLLTMQHQESSGENEFFGGRGGPFLQLFSALGIDTTGFSPVNSSSLLASLKYISRDHSLILVHNVWTGRAELEEIRAAGVSLPELYWCLCPNANRYITGDLPDILLLQQYGAKLVIGTDSLASNWQLSVLEELQTLHRHFPSIPPAELLRWATSQGAAALRIDDWAGSFAKGRQPGVLLIRHADAHPLQNAAVERML